MTHIVNDALYHANMIFQREQPAGSPEENRNDRDGHRTASPQPGRNGSRARTAVRQAAYGRALYLLRSYGAARLGAGAGSWRGRKAASPYRPGHGDLSVFRGDHASRQPGLSTGNPSP